MRPFSGVTAAAVTPHGKRGNETDIGATLELIDFLCAAGVQGIALLGSTGEFVTLSCNDRARLVYLAVKRSRVPVLAGVSHTTLDGALALAREATAAGAAGLLVMPPYFFRYGQAEIREFYMAFAAGAAHGAPIYLYNIPAFTSPLAVETAVELLATGKFAGIKDSSGDWNYFETLSKSAAERTFPLLVGHDGIFARARAAGADGVVSGVACAVPELLLALDRAGAEGAGPEIARLDGRLHEFLDRIDRFPTPVGIKAALQVRGIRTGPFAVPLAPETRAELEEFKEWFRGWL
jgi:4-hydroxy-tetrahydrodipicolinate synthase